jgi:predicted dehydrogenase
MAHETLRVGLVGAGANTRTRHIPGLRALPAVEIVAVCNRRPESTREVAAEFGIPRTFTAWEDLVADPALDAVVIGTWPYLHAPVTVAALQAGKHVLCEARMARNTAEAREMLAASRAHPHLVAQLVPSPFGLKGHALMIDLIRGGFLGRLLEVSVVARNASLADPDSPLHWRQDANLSGLNMLTLGIVHETILRWVAAPVRVLAQTHAFIPTRRDPESGTPRPVGTPDSVQVLTVLPNEARAGYQCSGVTPFGQEMSITLYGRDGVLSYDLLHDRILGASRTRGEGPLQISALSEIPIPADKAGGWNVEADFVNSIREGLPVQLTDFATGVSYMEFTEAVVRSAWQGAAVDLPLAQL